MAFPPYTKTFHTKFYNAISPSRPELSTAGKVVLITGGGSGIGPRVTHAFAASGATRIAILGRTASSLLSTKEDVESQYPGSKVLTFVADITDKAAVTSAFEETKKQFGAIDIFISNAAYLPNGESIATADVDEVCTLFVCEDLKPNINIPVVPRHGGQRERKPHPLTGFPRQLVQESNLYRSQYCRSSCSCYSVPSECICHKQVRPYQIDGLPRGRKSSCEGNASSSRVPANRNEPKGSRCWFLQCFR